MADRTSAVRTIPSDSDPNPDEALRRVRAADEAIRARKPVTR
ncbi:hypothetical protein ACFWA1_35850 [Streptomyces sp. NPDC060005]